MVITCNPREVATHVGDATLAVPHALVLTVLTASHAHSISLTIQQNQHALLLTTKLYRPLNSPTSFMDSVNYPHGHYLTFQLIK